MTDVLAFGTYDTRLHPRVAVLMEGLRANGHEVDELNRPIGIGTSGRVAALSSPSAAAKFGAALAKRWLQLIGGSFAYRGASRPRTILVGYLGHFDVILARILYPRTRIVLDHLIFAADTAKDRRLDGGRVKSALLEALDRIALWSASIVVVDTESHRELLVARNTKRTGIVVPVGAPHEWFHTPSPNAEEAAPVSIVFFGLFTPLQGTATIAEALHKLDERGVSCHATLIGTGQDYDKCRAVLADSTTGSVQINWISWVDGAELPGVVAAHDICLGIFGTSEKARRVVPNKAFQGMAAGCALVTSDTPPQRHMLEGAAVLVQPGDSDGLAAALEQLIENPEALGQWKSRAQECAANEFTPAKVTAELSEVLS